MLKLRAPSPAMGVALFALFVALSGVGVAASNLPNNSVGTAQIRNDSVTAAKIAHDSIPSVLIKNGSLTAADFAAGQIPAGPKGDKGDTGATGPQGLQGQKGDRGLAGPAGVMGTMAVAKAGVWVADDSAATVYVSVPAGKQATGATASWTLPNDPGVGYISIRPDISPAGHVEGYWATGYNHDSVHHHYFTLYVPYG
jgi:hypothetical protein